MDLHQFWFDGLAHASYMLSDGRDAIVVDPALEIEQYLEAAQERRVTIRDVVETHVHADFVSGHVELSEATGARVWFGPNAQTQFPAHAIEDGVEIPFGRGVLRGLSTPGHTPDSVTLVVDDLSGRPVALTGDTLFVGDVGRPDLAAGGSMNVHDMARTLYASLVEKVLRLPDDTVVYPAHGCGSLCGKSLGTARSSTIAAERATNVALLPGTEDAFVRYVTSDLPVQPAYFARAARTNRGGPMRRAEYLSAIRALTPDALAREIDDGAIVLDTRDEDVFARGHIPGAISIALCDKLGAWAGTVLPVDARLVVCADPGTERAAALELLRVGAPPPSGYLVKGFDAWCEAGRPVETLREYSPRDLPLGSGVTIVDVRSSAEADTGRIADAMLVPLTELPRRLGEFSPEASYVFVCASGFRSTIGATLVRRAGVRGVANLAGGMMSVIEQTGRDRLA